MIKGGHLSPEHNLKIRESIRITNLWKQGICRECGVHITPEQADKSNLQRCNSWICKSCERERGRAKFRRMKNKVLEAYGNICACCGETKPEFLTMHHVNKDGAEHRRTIGDNPNYLRWFLRDNKYPKFEYQLLCYNCNCSLGYYGYCPHKSLSK